TKTTRTDVCLQLVHFILQLSAKAGKGERRHKDTEASKKTRKDGRLGGLIGFELTLDSWFVRKSNEPITRHASTDKKKVKCLNWKWRVLHYRPRVVAGLVTDS